MTIPYTIGTIKEDSAFTTEVAPPAHNDGDLLILCGVGGDNVNIGVSGEAGWAEHIEQQSAEQGDNTATIWWTIANNEPATITFGKLEGSTPILLRAVIYKIAAGDFDSSSPFDVAATANANQNNRDNPTAPPITTVTDGCLILTMVGGVQCVAQARTQPSGYTLDADNQGTCAIATATRSQASKGTETPGDWAGMGADTPDCTTLTAAIRPDLSGATINRVLTENAVVTDPVPGYQLTQERPANSNVGVFSEAMFLFYAFGRLVTDYLPLTDQYVIEQNVRRDLADVATMADAIEVIHGYFKSVSDAIAMSDGFIKSVTIGEVGTIYNRIRYDSLNVSDFIDAAFIGIVTKQQSDSIALGEAEFLTRFTNRSLSEQIAIVTDLMNISYARSKVLLDTFGTTDALSIQRTRINNITVLDVFSLVDSFERDLQYIKRKKLIDAASVVDSKWFESGTTLKPAVPIITGIEER